MRKLLRLFLFEAIILVVVTASLDLWATQRTWDGGATASGKWSNDTNWSGDTKSATGDTAIFNNTSVRPCTLDASPSLGKIKLNSNYTGHFIMTGYGITTTAGGTTGTAHDRPLLSPSRSGKKRATRLYHDRRVE